MTTTHSYHPRARRRIDVASLLLLLVGLAVGVLAYWLVQNGNVNTLVIVPSVVAVLTGTRHLMKREAPHS